MIKGRKMDPILTGKSVLETGVLDAARGQNSYEEGLSKHHKVYQIQSGFPV